MFGFLRRKIEEATLNAIFKVALEGMENFNFPGGLTNAGKFELLMFDIWFGTIFVEKRGLDFDFDLKLKKIDSFLTQLGEMLHLPSIGGFDALYVLRQEGWDYDLYHLLHSDYPRTKQYISGYLYLCIIVEPFILYEIGEEYFYKLMQLEKENMKRGRYEGLLFTRAFYEHHSWLVKQLHQQINHC